MLRKIAFIILRVGLGIVFLLFGMNKFRGDIWAQTISNMEFFKHLPWNVNVSICLIGGSEIVVGVLLIAGVFIRFAGIIASAELLAILILLKFSETRDIGLLASAFYIAAAPSDDFGVVWFIKKITRKNFGTKILYNKK